MQDKKILEVNVEKGMQHNQKIVFQGEADEAPDTTPGDIVFVVQQKEHPVFKRKGARPAARPPPRGCRLPRPAPCPARLSLRRLIGPEAGRCAVDQAPTCSTKRR